MAFHAGVKFGDHHLYWDQLPKPPQNWKQLLKHLYQNGFYAAAEKEYRGLKWQGTFQAVSKTPKIKILLVIWVFTYKFDSDGYLIKYKARLCVQGDLQKADYKDNYAATLAARTFRALIAILATFDLKAFYYDAINAFTNSQMKEIIYCQTPDGFKCAGMCLFLLRALYSLRQSPLLWLKEFLRTLVDLGLI